jgi:putative PIN family toxin of toxin-antitoxin system
MKVVFDTNVYVAEALGGETARRILDSTQRASWHTFISQYIVEELLAVMVEDLGLPRRSATLAGVRSLRRARVVEPAPSRHQVAADAADTAILGTARQAGADYLVTNDAHLLALHPYEGLQIITMADYRRLLEDRGLLV